MLFATGVAKHPRVPAEGGAILKDFARALNEVLMDLALMVARDGEGAQKLIRIDVTGATTARSAHRIAMSIANSPLVKTAIAGEDANWGRIVMAVGKSGEPADRDLLSIAVGGTWMARNGGVVDGYDETPVVAHMKGRRSRSRSTSAWVRARPPCGPATSPTGTSTSTVRIGPEASISR